MQTIRLALSGHVGIPRENELDFLTKAELVFTPPQKKVKTQTTKSTPTATLSLNQRSKR